MSDIAEVIERLFFCRTDVYALQSYDGKGYRKVDSAITHDILLAHLDGSLTLGSYQLNKESKVKWICYDFDQDTSAHDAQVLLSIIRESEYANSVMLEDTGNGERRHLWIFFDEPISARYARALAKSFLENVKITCEVFPKQNEISESGYGNLVKLPLGINRKTGRFSTLLFPPSLEEVKPFHVSNDALQEVELNTRMKLRTMFVRRTRFCIQDISNNPLDEKGNDRFEKRRNMTAMALAMAIHRDAPWLSQEMVLGALRIWNDNLKSQLPMFELTGIVERVFDNEYTFGCATIRDNESLADFCKPDMCPFGLQFLNNMEALKWLKNFSVESIRPWKTNKIENYIEGVCLAVEQSDKGVGLVLMVKEEDNTQAYRVFLPTDASLIENQPELLKIYRVTYLGNIEMRNSVYGFRKLTEVAASAPQA